MTVTDSWIVPNNQWSVDGSNEKEHVIYCIRYCLAISNSPVKRFSLDLQVLMSTRLSNDNPLVSTKRLSTTHHG